MPIPFQEKHEKGFYPYSARGPEKLYLYEVISNKQTGEARAVHRPPGMDVDKMDYLLRDAKALKIKLKWELSRYLKKKKYFFDYQAFKLILMQALSSLSAEYRSEFPGSWRLESRSPWTSPTPTLTRPL